MAQLQLRPFSVGEVIDAAFSVYKNHFKQLITITAVVVVPLGVVQALLTAQILADPDALSASTAGASLAVALLGMVVTQVATAAITLAVADAYLDNHSTWQSSISAAFARTGSVVVASLLFGLAIGLGAIALLVGAIFLGAALGVFMPALMVERLTATASIGRSWRLTSGHRGRVFGAWFLAFLITLLLSLAISAVIGIAITTGTATVGAQMIGIVGSVLTTPFLAAVVVIIYFDLRVRKEGFDLELLASQLLTADSTALAPRSDTNPPPEASGDGGEAWPPPADR